MDFKSFIFWNSVFSSSQEKYQPKKPSSEQFQRLTKTNIELEKKLREKFTALVLSEIQQNEKREKVDSFFLEIKILYAFFGVPFIPRKSLSLSDANATYEEDEEYLDEQWKFASQYPYNKSMVEFISSNKTAKEMYGFLIDQLLMRHMYDLGYSVSLDGIHDSQWQELDKWVKEGTARREKYPWL